MERWEKQFSVFKTKNELNNNSQRGFTEKVLNIKRVGGGGNLPYLLPPVPYVPSPTVTQEHFHDKTK